MKTEYLLTVVLLALILPWAVLVSDHSRTVGMYADERHVLFSGDSDVYDCIWHFSWVKESLSNRTDPRVYAGKTLAWNNMAWPTLFISFIFGYGYQLSLLFSSLLTGAAGYFLARSWGLGKNGSLLAALVIVWMPVRLIRMYQHYPVASAGYALFALGMMRRWLTGGKRILLLWVFLFSALAVMEGFQHGITIALGWAVTVFLSGWKGWRRTSLSALIPAAGCIAGSLWLLTSPGVTGTDPGMEWRESVYWGAELQSYFLPSFLGRPLVTGYMPNPFEGVVSPGLTVMILAVLYCIRGKHWKAAAATAALMVMSVGPLFKLGGIPTPVPLPYMIIAKAPLLSAARAPARLGILVGFAAALAAGAMIEKKGRVAGWILTALVVLELTPVTLNSIDSTVPLFYRWGNPVPPVLEIPASSAIRKYSLFESVDMLPRRVKFFARGGEEMMEGIPAGLAWNPSVPPVRDDLQRTGASTVVYNRWMFPPDEKSFYDSLYTGIFTSDERGDSVWIWRAE